MKRFLGAKSVGNILLAKGILIALLGIVHVAGAFTTEAAKIARVASPQVGHDYLVWFAGVGVFLLFLGGIDLLCQGPIRQGDPLARKIAWFGSTTIALYGSCGVALYGISPPLALMVAGWTAVAALAFHDPRKV